MKMGLLLEGKDLFYDALHLYGAKHYLKQTKTDLVAYVAEVKPEEKKGIFRKKSGSLKENPAKNAYIEFFKEQVKEVKEYTSKKLFEELDFTLGKLIIPKTYKEQILSTDKENFVSAGILINKGVFERLIDKAKRLGIEPPVNDRYLFCSIKEETFTKAEYVSSLAEELNIKLVCDGASEKKRYSNAVYVSDSGPYERLISIFGAKLIVTDSIAVLEAAIIMRKSFLFVSGAKEEGRAALILEQLGLLNHFVYDAAAVDDSVEFKLPEEEVFIKKIEAARKYASLQIKELFPFIDAGRLDPVDCPAYINKDDCYGCHACKEVCPKGAITMVEDEEGFLYPKTDYSKCVSCGLCAKVCQKNQTPYIKHPENDKRPYAVALYNKNQDMVCGGSSSGAVFPELVKYVLEEKKGAVVGVRYGENMMPVADIAFDYEHARLFFGSKYVKSDINGIYSRVKELLDKGTYVLYSGLSCECAGLRKFLMKKYDNLFICEILCHSVPSPKVYRKYLDYIEGKKDCKLKNLTFRNKDENFQKMVFEYENGDVIKANYWRNNYFRAFSNDLITRKSCGRCDFIFDQRSGDVTIGDFWGASKVAPDFENSKGTSIMVVNTKKGEEMLKNIRDKFEIMNISMEEAFIKNHKELKEIPSERETVFRRINSGEFINDVLAEYNDYLIK